MTFADTNNRIALKLLGSAYVPCPDGTVIYESCYQCVRGKVILHPQCKKVLDICNQCDGIFGGHDIYDLVTDWNRSYLSVGILEKPKRDDYTSSSQGERYYSNNLKWYEFKCRRLQGFINGKPDSYMAATYGDDWKRQIGIDLVHEKRSNKSLRFPIKICRNRPDSYDKIRPSTIAPHQGR